MPSLSLVNVPVASRGIHNHCIACQNWAQCSVHNVWWWGWGWCFPHSRTFRSQSGPSLLPSPFLQISFIPSENQEANLAQAFPSSLGCMEPCSSATRCQYHLSFRSLRVKQGPYYLYSLCRYFFNNYHRIYRAPSIKHPQQWYKHSNQDYFSSFIVLGP